MIAQTDPSIWSHPLTVAALVVVAGAVVAGVKWVISRAVANLDTHLRSIDTKIDGLTDWSRTIDTRLTTGEARMDRQDAELRAHMAREEAHHTADAALREARQREIDGRLAGIDSHLADIDGRLERIEEQGAE